MAELIRSVYAVDEHEALSEANWERERPVFYLASTPTNPDESAIDVWKPLALS